MDEGKIKSVAPDNAAGQNIRLTGEIMRWLSENPHIFSMLPEKFELVVFPDDDPEMRSYNLELLDKYSREDKPVVFARIKSARADISDTVSVYAPIAA